MEWNDLFVSPNIFQWMKQLPTVKWSERLQQHELFCFSGGQFVFCKYEICYLTDWLKALALTKRTWEKNKKPARIRINEFTRLSKRNLLSLYIYNLRSQPYFLCRVCRFWPLDKICLEMPKLDNVHVTKYLEGSRILVFTLPEAQKFFVLDDCRKY